MSRIGKKAIGIQNGVKVSVEGHLVVVEGPKGKLTQPLVDGISLDIQDKYINVTIAQPGREASMRQGLMRALVANMVKGVNQGFEKVLEINGVGYRAEKTGDAITFHLGYSHKIEFPIPQNIEILVEKPTRVVVRGMDSALVGQTAAKIRKLRRVDPYKVKGIIYEGEKIKRKAGKKAIT